VRRKAAKSEAGRSDSPPSSPEELNSPRREKKLDLLCIAVLLVLTLVVYAPALFAGKVLLPADTVLLMRPWGAHAQEKFPDFHFAQNQMHGPIFEYYSWRHYARERILAGEVPLWNPYELGGNVLLGNSQSAVLYPPNILLTLFSLPTGINLVTALHTFLTGLFMFLLLRRLKLKQPAALTGALTWMFCGLLTVWTEFQTPTAVLCWLPALLLCWEIYAQTGKWRWAVLGCGGVTTLALLAGHLHFAFYTVIALIFYALWRSALLNFRKSLRPVGMLIAALALGGLLSMATLLPVLEMGRMNFRRGQTNYASSIALRIPPAQLLTLFQPNLFGNPRDYVAFDAQGKATDGHPYWGGFDFIEFTAYLGIPALILVLSALFPFKLREEKKQASPNLPPSPLSPRLFFTLLVLLGLLLALGTPLCALFLYGVPGYSQFNATARALCLFSFGMAALAGYGVQRIHDALQNVETDRVKKSLTAATAFVMLGGFVAFPGTAPLWQVSDGTGHEVARLLTDQWFGYELAGLRNFIAFAVLTALALWLVLRPTKQASDNQKSKIKNQKFLWLLPGIAALDLLITFAGFNPITDPGMLGFSTGTTDFLQKASPKRTVSLETPGRGVKSFIVPNYNAVIHLRDVQGADSLHTKRYHHLMERVVMAMEPGRGGAFSDPNTIHVPAVTHPLFNLLNVAYVTTEPDRKLDETLFHQVDQQELTVWENPRALGEAWVVGAIERVEGQDQAFARLSAPDFNPRTTALLESPPPALGSTGGTASITEFSPHRISLDVTTQGNSLLVLSEIAFPGWKATVDNQPAPVLTADYILRSVPVPSGSHKVIVTYEPASYRVGLYLTSAASALFSAALAMQWGRKRRPAKPA
jgi:hypothetical protein